MPHATALDLRPDAVLAAPDPTEMAVFAFLTRYKGQTLANYRFDLKLFLGWCMAHDLRPLEVQRGHLELYGRWLEQYVSPTTRRPLAQSTIRRRVGTVLSFYKYAAMDDYLPKDPGVAVTRPKHDTEQQYRTYLAPLAFAAVLAESKRMGPMPHATISLLGMLGLRVSEACSLDIASVRVMRGWEVLHFVGKGNKAADVPLPIAVLHAVHAAIGDRTDGPLLLNQRGHRMARPNVQYLIDQVMRAAGVPGRCTPHGLRRTFITTGLLHGIPLRDMQIAARHADPKMTVLYDMMIGGFERHAAHQVSAYLASMAV